MKGANVTNEKDNKKDADINDGFDDGRETLHNGERWRLNDEKMPGDLFF